MKRGEESRNLNCALYSSGLVTFLSENQLKYYWRCIIKENEIAIQCLQSHYYFNSTINGCFMKSKIGEFNFVVRVFPI